MFYHSYPEFNIVGTISTETLEYKLKYLSLPDLKNKTVLDIGAWSGWFSYQCCKLGAKVTSIDRKQECVDHIKIINKLSNFNIEAERKDFLDYNVSHDMVLFLGVLYHMKHPLIGLEHLFNLTKETAIIETHVDDNNNYEGKSYMRFIPDNSLNNDHSNWWSPSVQCVIDMCTTVGFKTECIHKHHNRAIFKAYVC